MKLYGFFRSGTSHRLRIALNLKGLSPDYFPVDLRVDEQAQAPPPVAPPRAPEPRLLLRKLQRADSYRARAEDGKELVTTMQRTGPGSASR